MCVPIQIPFALFTLDKVIAEKCGTFTLLLNEVQKQHVGGITSEDFVCKSSSHRF